MTGWQSATKYRRAEGGLLAFIWKGSAGARKSCSTAMYLHAAAGVERKERLFSMKVDKTAKSDNYIGSYREKIQWLIRQL
jgi:hypothetical protein